jgi:hypothetical protein
MRRRHLLALATALVTSQSGAQPAKPAELAGVRLPATVQVGNATLQLNGAGIRYRFVVKVYVAGLYLAGNAATPEAALAAPGAKRMHVVMLRDIDANELGRLFTRGMQDNAPREEFAKSIPGTIRMGEIFAAKKRLAAGESFSLDWIPGQGSFVLVNGKPQGEAIKEPEFFNSVMRIWLGPKPADTQLKDALLGQAPKPVTSPGQQ